MGLRGRPTTVGIRGVDGHSLDSMRFAGRKFITPCVFGGLGMRCYFCIDEAWIKGTVVSMSGGKEINFSSDQEVAPRVDLTLWKPEVLFGGNHISITGFENLGDKRYKLVGVEVKFKKP